MKKLLHYTTMLLMLVLLTGCMKINVTMDIDRQGHMVMTYKELLSEQLLNIGGRSTDDSSSKVDGVFQSIKDQYKDDENVTITDIKETIDGVNYVGVLITGINGDDQKLVTVDHKTITVTLDEATIEQASGSNHEALNNYSAQQLKDMGVECTIIVNMPDIATSNYGVVNKKTVTIDLLTLKDEMQDNDQQVVITCDVPEDYTPRLILSIILTVIGLGIFIRFMMVRKKYQK